MRVAAFVGGLAAIWVAVESSLAELDHYLLTAHMMQHLILMVIAAPLILLSAPSLLSRHSILSHPVFCWLAGTVTVIVWHIPAIFNLSRESHHLHRIEQASFLLAG